MIPKRSSYRQVHYKHLHIPGLCAHTRTKDNDQ